MVMGPNTDSLPAVCNVAPIEGEPVVRWKAELYMYPYLGSPRALEGLLLCVAGGKDLVALDLQTGEPLWTYSHGEDISSPAIAGGIAYFTHARNQIIALDIATQKVRWQRETERSLRMPPTVADDAVYIGDRVHSFYSFDAYSGEEHWVFTTKGEMRAPATVRDGMIYLGCFDNRVYAIYANYGKMKWYFRTPHKVIHSTPAVDESTIYFGSNDFHMYAVDRESGELRWKFKGGTWIRTSPVVHKGRVFFGCYLDISPRNYLYALNADTGEVVWRIEVEDIGAGPFIVGNHLYILSGDDLLLRLDPDTGEETWSSTHQWGYLTSVAFGNRAMYVISHSERKLEKPSIWALGEAQ